MIPGDCRANLGEVWRFIGDGVDPEDILVLALAQGLSLTEATDKSGLSYNTVRARNRDPKVKARVDEIRQELLSQQLGKIAQGGNTSMDTLIRNQDAAQPAHIQINAAKIFLESSVKVRDSIDLAARVKALEERGNRIDPAELPPPVPLEPGDDL